jgi:hypothetical protein
MKKPIIIALALALGSATAVMAQATSADPGHPRINEVEQRIQNQQDRVDKGVSDGQITAKQATKDDAKLAREQNSLNQDAAKNGGHITKAEQRNLNRRLNKGSRTIHRQRQAGK